MGVPRVRIPFDGPAEFIAAYVADQSLDGLFVATEMGAPIGSDVEVVIEFKNGKGFEVGAELSCEQTAESARHRCAVRFPYFPDAQQGGRD